MDAIAMFRLLTDERQTAVQPHAGKRMISGYWIASRFTADRTNYRKVPLGTSPKSVFTGNTRYTAPIP
jgi:hypothetical protein